MERAPLSKNAVIAAAADLADREGFDAVSVSALARQFGVQPASLYSHVRDRAAVLAGVHELALAGLADVVAEQTAGRAGRDALAGLADAHAGYAREHPGRWGALQRPASPQTAGSEGAVRLVALIFAVLRAYALPDDELVHATRFVGAAINGFLALDRAESFAHRATGSDESWRRTVDALDRSLRTWPGSEGESA